MGLTHASFRVILLEAVIPDARTGGGRRKTEMRFPWANTLLLIFLAMELASGFFGLISGSEDRAIYILLHRISGYGILAVLGWKAANVARSLKWPRDAGSRWASVILAALLVVCLALGFAWSLIGPYYWWLFSGVSWHIYVGAALAPLLIWHAWKMTRGVPTRFWAERRLILRAGGMALAGFVGWQMSEGIARAADLSGQSRRFTGSYEAKNMSGNDFPRVSWLNDNPARIDAEAWRLRVFGASERELVLSYNDLDGRSETTATIDCTGGWHSTQRWRGVPLGDLIRDANLSEDARSVVVRSVTGYYRKFSMAAAREFLLATHVTGERLSHGHGFPLRLAAPGRRGFEWVKWVVEIEISDTPAWWQPPLPLQ